MDTYILLLTVFTGLVALAMVVQGIAILIIAMRVKAMSARVEDMSTRVMKQFDRIVPQVEGFIPVFRSMVDKVHAMEENLAGISQLAHERALKVDAFVDEATDTARLQMARLQDVIDTTSQRIDETVTSLQVAVSAPIHEIQAIARGIRTGVDVLFGRRKMNNRSHEEEEMFI